MLTSEIAHIISPTSAPWSGWVLLALFLCAVFGEFMQPGIILQSGSLIFSQTDRTYKNAPANTFGQLLISIFRIGTLGMAICISLYTDGHFPFAAFAAISGLIFATLLLKMLCNGLLNYTFKLSNRFMPIYEQYGDIATVASCLLYPSILALLRIGHSEYILWALGITTLLFLALIAFRIARTYIQSPMAILYVALYIGTLEVLPLGALYYLSSKTISYL